MALADIYVLVKNIFANYIGTGLVGLINIFSLSLYVKWLGMAHWGEVATYLAIMNSLMVLELGISQVYIAQRHQQDAPLDLFLRFRSALISLALAGSLGACIGLLTLNWVVADLPVIYQRWDLLVMALGLFSLNLVNNFYYTNLMAIGRQIEQNARWVSFVLLKNGLALILVVFVSNQPEVYFLAFLVVTTFEVWMNSKTTDEPLATFCKWADVLSVVKQSGLLSLAIGLGILVFNLDRLVLPSLTTPESFGVYATVVTVGLYFLQLQYPITKALFPVLAKKIHLDPGAAGAAMWQQVLLLAGLLAPLLFVASLFADQILGFYSVPESYIQDARWLFNGLLLAVLINAAYHGIYMRLVVESRDRIIALINLATLVVALTILSWLGAEMPFVAGALAWCLVSGIQLLGSTGFYRWFQRHAIR